MAIGVSSSRTPKMAPAPACVAPKARLQRCPRRLNQALPRRSQAQPRRSPAQPRPIKSLPLLDVCVCIRPVECAAVLRVLDEHHRTRAERAIVTVSVLRRDALSNGRGLHGVGEDPADLPRAEVEGSDCRRVHIVREEYGVGDLDTRHAQQRPGCSAEERVLGQGGGCGKPNGTAKVVCQNGAPVCGARSHTAPA